MADYDFDLVIVGRGYSASTYLFTADLSWCKNIMIIAGPDAWQNVVRGDGIVNHAGYIFARNNPGNLRERDLPPRTRLKDENAAILTKSIDWLRAQQVDVTNQPVAGVVTKIERKVIALGGDIEKGPKVLVNGKEQSAFSKKKGTKADVYEVTYNKWDQLPGANWSNVTSKPVVQPIKAMKVIYCGGAGPHADYYRPGGAGYMDLDTFMRNKEIKGNNKKVAVIGPNAGIDAAIEALNRELKLYWLISGPTNSSPAWLSTKHYKIEDIDQGQVIKTAEDRIVNYPKSERFKLKKNDHEEKYTFTFKSDVKTRGDESLNMQLIVDYVVYATGQDPGKQEVAKGRNDAQVVTRIGAYKVLEPILKLEKLTPIYDTNQRFGGYFETALGLQDSVRSPYTGLEVLGAAAFALAGYKRGSYVHQAFFKDYAADTRALDIPVQGGQNLENALKAIQNTTWNDRSQGTRLYDYFNDRGTIPSVGESMSAILKKLYQQSLTTADQLGTIKSQIEAVTGFDIIAASTGGTELLEKTSAYMQAIEPFKRAMKDLNDATVALAKKSDDEKLKAEEDSAYKKARDERDKYWAADRKFWNLDNSVNQAAKEYVQLLSPEDQATLEQQGFDANNFAATINDKNQALFNATTCGLYLGGTAYQQAVLVAIPRLQRWLTNLLVIFQIPVGANIDGILNYNSMDRTQLAVLLAVKYPSIAVTDWPEITTLILAGRKVSPWGYGQDQVTKINVWLKGVNDGTKAVGEFPELNPQL